MNGYLPLILKAVGWLVAIVLAFGSLKVDVGVLSSKIDDLDRRIARIERLLDRIYERQNLP